MHAYRSHTCAQLNKDHVGKDVRLAGWVHRVRDHGGVLFIDLRDHYGVTQVLADSDSPAFAEIEKLRAEWVVSIDGVVKARDASLVNPKLATGEIEVYIKGVRVLGAVDVGRTLGFRAGGHVVDRGEMEEMLDLLRRQRADLRGRQAALRRGHVAGHRQHPLRVPAHLLRQRIELLERVLAHQHMDRALALEQVADQETAQEPGTAGDEVAHARSPCERQRARNAPCAPTLPEGGPANNSPAY